jgi:hypothetical protein
MSAKRLGKLLAGCDASPCPMMRSCGLAALRARRGTNAAIGNQRASARPPGSSKMMKVTPAPLGSPAMGSWRSTAARCGIGSPRTSCDHHPPTSSRPSGATNPRLTQAPDGHQGGPWPHAEPNASSELQDSDNSLFCTGSSDVAHGAPASTPLCCCDGHERERLRLPCVRPPDAARKRAQSRAV